MYSKEPFIVFGFRLQLVPKTSILSQLQNSYDMIISLIGRQNKMTLRQINEENYDVAEASLTYFVQNGFAWHLERTLSEKIYPLLTFLPLDPQTAPELWSCMDP